MAFLSAPRLVFLSPDADQAARKLMPWGERVRGLNPMLLERWLAFILRKAS